MVTGVAILGAGIGQQHLDAYLALPDLFKVLLVVDKDIAKANALASLAQCETSDSIATALQDPDIDIIDICLPPHLHVPVSRDAIRAGKHVICEKPIATSLSELEEVRTLLLQKGTRFYPVFQYRWGPSLAVLRHLIGTGLAGEPHVATLETHWNRDDDYYSIDWRGTWAGEKGGAVLGHAIHNHDLLTHIMGPVASVSAMTGTRINPIETEDCAAISFQMENGSMATSNITLGHATDETRLRFVFEHLTATSGQEPYAPGNAKWEFVARDPSHQPKVDATVKNAPSEGLGFAGMFNEIAKEISGEANNAVRFEDGLASIELVTAIYYAATTGHRVSLPLSTDNPFYTGWQPESSTR